MSTDCHVTCLEAAENLQGFQSIYSALSRSWEGDFDGKNGGEFSVASHVTEF